MIIKKAVLSCFVVYFFSGLKTAAASLGDTVLQKQYLAELQTIGRTFSRPFRQLYTFNYSLPEQAFLAKIDSARELLYGVLDRYRGRLDTAFIREQEMELNYYLDRLIVDYPDNFAVYTGKAFTDHPRIVARLAHNSADFNQPDLLISSDFTDYARAFFSFQINRELQKPVYRGTDNQELQAIWKIIPRFVMNKKCREFWKYDYLANHIVNKGIKNIAGIYHNFMGSCNDSTLLHKIEVSYHEDLQGRQSHLVKTYKNTGLIKLDIHMFLPVKRAGDKKHPVMVYFHGGSWSEGKPDWFFEACANEAKNGWVACAVEYRIYGRQRTLPFEAVKDARSVIRWLRQHADEYDIDTSRIVASGNSAGGHLALACAMAVGVNEKTDNLDFSPVPNLLLINSGVYDLTDAGNAWIRRTLKDKDLVKQISPDFLVRKGMPPTLAIHGTNDGNVPFMSAKVFEAEMTKAGNPLEFHALPGATHFIWLDRRYSGTVDSLQNAFLKRLGY